MPTFLEEKTLSANLTEMRGKGNVQGLDPCQNLPKQFILFQTSLSSMLTITMNYSHSFYTNYSRTLDEFYSIALKSAWERKSSGTAIESSTTVLSYESYENST